MTEENGNTLLTGVFDPQKAGALMSEWLTRQKAAFEAISAKFPTSGKGADAAELWRSYMEFWNTLSKVMPAQAGAQESVMETLVGPLSGLLGGGSTEDVIQQMSQGPALA